MTSPRDTIRKRMGAFKSRRFLEEIGGALYECADAVQSEAHHSISAGSASGRKGGKHQHVVSNPGEPPNRQDGDLQGGLEISRPEPLVAQVSSNAPHAVPLEFGTSKMAARPYMRPARDKTLPRAKRILRQRIKHFRRKYGV